MVKKFYEYLRRTKFPAVDKLQHLLVGDYLAFISFVLISIIVFIFKISEYWYLTLPIPSFVIGYLKEYFDKKYDLGNSEKMDFFYTVKMSLQYTIIIITIISILTIKN